MTETPGHIVLKRKDGYIQLGYNYYLPTENVQGNNIIKQARLFRIEEYKKEEKILYLKNDGDANEHLFEQSAILINNWLIENEPVKIVIKNSYREAIIDWSRPPEVTFQRPNLVELIRKPETFTEQLNVDICDSNFEDGLIRCKVYSKKMKMEIEVNVENSFIAKSFDSVKDYFKKVLKKPFDIEITITHEGKNILSQSVKSETIKSIDASVITKIEELQIDDLFNGLDNDEIIELNQFPPTILEKAKEENWLWDYLIQENKTKHYYHLRYLSSLQEIEFDKLKITGKPLSFLFVIKSSNSLFLVWETYETEEATYIWEIKESSESGKRERCNELIDIIKGIRRNKKLEYIRENHKDFKRIFHQYQLDKFGFETWKKEINEFLIKDSILIIKR